MDWTKSGGIKYLYITVLYLKKCFDWGEFMRKKEKITRGMTLGEIIKEYPETVEVMLKRGLHCVGCHIAAWETLEQGAKAHGMSDKDIESMLKEMNGVVKNIKEESKK